MCPDQGAVVPPSAFWERLLGGRFHDEQLAQMVEMGKGRRARRKVRKEGGTDAHHLSLSQSLSQSLANHLWLAVMTSPADPLKIVSYTDEDGGEQQQDDLSDEDYRSPSGEESMSSSGEEDGHPEGGSNSSSSMLSLCFGQMQSLQPPSFSDAKEFNLQKQRAQEAGERPCGATPPTLLHTLVPPITLVWPPQSDGVFHLLPSVVVRGHHQVPRGRALLLLRL